MYENEYKYRMLQSVCGYADEITVNLDKISDELKKDLADLSLPRLEAVDKGVDGFRNFLEGKTSRDFRNLADDMNRNGTGTFEEYERKHMSGELDWQKEERGKKMKQIDRNIMERN